jgi:hypothetical protein
VVLHSFPETLIGLAAVVTLVGVALYLGGRATGRQPSRMACLFVGTLAGTVAFYLGWTDTLGQYFHGLRLAAGWADHTHSR